MEKSKKIKIIIGLFYFVVLFVFLFFIFQRFSIDELTSYEFIKENREYFLSLRGTKTFESLKGNFLIVDISRWS